MAIDVSSEFFCVLAPLLVSLPLYFLGRRLFFKTVKPSEMLTIMPGRIFMLSVCAIHLVLTVELYLQFFW